MRGYSQLADLESLLLNIPDKNIRAYAGEAIASYSAGAYRAAIVSIWIAVVYDLYQKFRLLNEQYGDPAAKICVENIDKIRNNDDKKQVAAWEREILEKAYVEVRIITSTEYDHLDRIQKDRHRCAHPVLDDEGFLFQPTPELARTHIRTAIEVLLCQPPIIGKASGDALIRDVEGTSNFPDELGGVKNALHKRHFQTSDKYRLNLFKLTLKKILFLEPKNEDIIERYLLVFQCLLNEYRKTFESIEKKDLSKIFEQTQEDRYIFLIRIIYQDMSLWENISDFTKEKLKSYLKSKNGLDKKELLYALSIIPEIEEEVFQIYLNFNNKLKQDFIEYSIEIGLPNKKIDFFKKIVKENIEIFSKSSTFRSGIENGKNLISPITSILDVNNIKYLLEKSIREQEKAQYDQLESCTDYFIEVFKKTIDKYPETLSDWKVFLEKKRNRSWSNFEKLENLVKERLETSSI